MQLATEPGSDWDLFQTERFVLDEVLQLICDRTLAIIQADGVILALAEENAMVCRAASGPLVVARGNRLAESEFLHDCLDAGRILRCDDCDVDGRVELDLSCELGARSTVLVPLRGRRSRLGVLQAFSNTPFAFSDDDVRCLDLFAELVLSALQPEDQDRRLNWLAEVADEILNPKLAAARWRNRRKQPALKRIQRPSQSRRQRVSSQAQQNTSLRLPIRSRSCPPKILLPMKPSDFGEIPVPFLASLNLPANSRPGLNFVLILMAVAALFATGVWWGMRDHRAAVATELRQPRFRRPQRPRSRLRPQTTCSIRPSWIPIRCRPLLRVRASWPQCPRLLGSATGLLRSEARS